jgi:hypothetical protein
MLVGVPLLASVHHGIKIWSQLGFQVYDTSCEEALLYITRINLQKVDPTWTRI